MLKIFRIRLYYLQVIRAVNIVLILIRNAFITWLGGKRLFRGMVSKKYKHNGIVYTGAERTRMILEELGPTFVKFGQILADRPDIVSEKLRLELKKLQSSAEPFSHAWAKELIEKELGGSIKKFFSDFDENCIGSASIGQVYKATMLSGEDVIVKIQRPHIESKIKLDLYLMRYIAKKVVKEYPGLQAMDIVGFVDEFGKTLQQELDYFSEASNAARFEELFRDVEYCKIPHVYMELSTRKLLVMEYIHGVRPDNIPALIDAGNDPRQVAENGMHILLRMIMKHGFFHADPHPGNIYILENNRMALMDFGMVGVLKPAHMNFLASFTMGMATHNARIVSEALLTLCGKKFFPERDDLEFEVQDMINRYSYIPYDRMDISKVLNECVKIMLKYQLRLPSSIYLLLKAVATLEKLGSNLTNEISLPLIMRPYAEDLVKQKFSPKAIANELFDTARDYISLIRDFPGEVNEILYRLKEGKLMIDIKLKDQQMIARSAGVFGRAMAIGLILGFMMIGSAMMLIWGENQRLANFLFVASISVSSLVLLRILFRSRPT